MNIMASQITDNSTVCLNLVCLCLQQTKYQSFVLLTICEGNPLVTGGFPSAKVLFMILLIRVCYGEYKGHTVKAFMRILF